MEDEREIRLSPEEFEIILRNVKLIETNEAFYEAKIEPGELVIKAVR